MHDLHAVQRCNLVFLPLRSGFVFSMWHFHWIRCCMCMCKLARTRTHTHTKLVFKMENRIRINFFLREKERWKRGWADENAFSFAATETRHSSCILPHPLSPWQLIIPQQGAIIPTRWIHSCRRRVVMLLSPLLLLYLPLFFLISSIRVLNVPLFSAKKKLCKNK